jgi:Fur family iron response transcriptional regulator
MSSPSAFIGPSKTAVAGLTPARERALIQRLRAANLRTTQPRIQLAHLLFGQGDRHLTAENLFSEAKAAGLTVSLATVYNALNQFLEAGLLREVIVDSGRSYFDTNLTDHFHFYVDGTGELIDVPPQSIAITEMPKTPDGFRVSGVDVVLRLEPKSK